MEERAMRTTIIITFLGLLWAESFAQTPSARLAGMGNLSIAVPDPLAEVFINPAKATRLKGMVVRGNPFYSTYSRKTSSFYKQDSPPQTNGSENDLSTSQFLLPADFFLSLGTLAVAGSVAIGSDARNSRGNYENSSSESRYTSNGETEGALVQKRVTGRAAIDLGSITLGAAATLGSGTDNLKSAFSYSSSSFGGSSSTSSSSEFKTEVSERNFQIGAVIGSADALEISIVGELQTGKSENRPTKIVNDGRPDPLTRPPIGYEETMSGNVIGDFRFWLSERLLLGGRARIVSETRNASRKAEYYDEGSASPTYEERKSGEQKTSASQFAVALTYQAAHAAVVGIELAIGPISTTQKNFYTTRGTASGNRRYSPGDVMSELTRNGTLKSLTLGGEIALDENLLVRTGGQTGWVFYESTYDEHYYQQNQESRGAPNSYFSFSGGLTYSVGALRFDYALGVIPNIFYTGFFGPSPYSSFSFDVRFQHYLTVTVSL